MRRASLRIDGTLLLGNLDQAGTIIHLKHSKEVSELMSCLAANPFRDSGTTKDYTSLTTLEHQRQNRAVCPRDGLPSSMSCQRCKPTRQARLLSQLDSCTRFGQSLASSSGEKFSSGWFRSGHRLAVSIVTDHPWTAEATPEPLPPDTQNQ